MTRFLPAGDPRLDDALNQFRYTAFRFEALPVYRSSGEDDWIAAFERGDPAPPPDPAQDEWEAMLRAHHAAGRIMQRVHAVTEPLSDYLRFELAWMYPPSIAAGEDVRIADVTGGCPDDLPRQDFHLRDSSPALSRPLHRRRHLARRRAGHRSRRDHPGVPVARRAVAPGHPLGALHRSSPRPGRQGRGVGWVCWIGTPTVPPTISTARRRLGVRLRELRARRFRSGAALGEHLGWPQSRVSKLETGTQLPSETDLDRWCEAIGADIQVRTELAELVMTARLDYQTWVEPWADLAQSAQPRTPSPPKRRRPPGSVVAARRDSRSGADGRLCARAAHRAGRAGAHGGSTVEIDGLIAARMRRQNLLYMPGKTIQLVIGEAALRTWFGSPDTMRGQCDRLIQVVELSNVELGIMPFDRANPVPGFSGDLLGSETVFVESLTGEQRIGAPDEVAVYLKAFDAAGRRRCGGETQCRSYNAWPPRWPDQPRGPTDDAGRNDIRHDVHRRFAEQRPSLGGAAGL